MTANNIISEDLKILVLRSNIDTPKSAALVRSELLQVNWIYSVDIDLGDPENVLRLECHPTCQTEKLQNRLYNGISSALNFMLIDKLYGVICNDQPIFKQSIIYECIELVWRIWESLFTRQLLSLSTEKYKIESYKEVFYL